MYFVHVVFPLQWRAYDFTAMSPLKLQSIAPGSHSNRIFIRRGAEQMTLLKYRLSTACRIKSLTFNQLKLIGEYFGMARAFSRTNCLEHLARAACEGEALDVVEAFVKEVLRLDGLKSDTEHVDATSEAVFMEMDQDDRKEYACLGKDIEEQGRKRRISCFEQSYFGTRNQRMKGKGKGKGRRAPPGNRKGEGKGGGNADSNGGGDGGGKGKGDGKGDGKGIVVQLGREPVVRCPDAFEWSSGNLSLFHFAKLQRSANRMCGYKVTCRFHCPAQSGRGAGLLSLPCGREQTTTDDSEESLHQCLLSLMTWCLHAGEARDRHDHKDPRRFPFREPAAEERIDLDRRLAITCQYVRDHGSEFPHLASRIVP